MASDRVSVWPELSVQADADDEPVLLTVRVIWEGSLLLWQCRELIHCLLQRRGSIRIGHWFRRDAAQFCSAYDLVFGGGPYLDSYKACATKRRRLGASEAEAIASEQEYVMKTEAVLLMLTWLSEDRQHKKDQRRSKALLQAWLRKFTHR